MKDLREIAFDLLLTNGYVTSLDLKNKFRENGGKIIQKTCSMYLDKLSEENGLLVEYVNGENNYKKYSFPVLTSTTDGQYVQVEKNE